MNIALRPPEAVVVWRFDVVDLGDVDDHLEAMVVNRAVMRDHGALGPRADRIATWLIDALLDWRCAMASVESDRLRVVWRGSWPGSREPMWPGQVEGVSA